MSDKIEVTLKRHKGMKSTGYGVVEEVDAGQDVIYVNGIYAGYAPDNGQVSLLSHGASPETKAEILRQVEVLKDKSNLKLVDVPTLEESNVQLVADDEPLM